MKEITYLIGDATKPIGEGQKAIIHVCNDIGGWGAGFVLALSRRWSEPERLYRKWFSDMTHFELGNVQFVPINNTQITVINMIAQHGVVSYFNPTPINYEALKKCLQKIAETISPDTSIHMPRIGCGLAGGKWEDIEPIIMHTFCKKDIAVYVYDLK